MIHIAKSLVVRLLLLLALLTILSAIIIGSLQLMAPLAGQFRGEIEQWLSDYAQRPVHIGGFSAHWRGLGPELVFDRVEVESSDGSGARLRLGEMRISLALLESLRNIAIKTRRITFSRAHLLVKRHADGTFGVGGLDRLGGGGGETVGFFSIPSTIRLEQSEIEFENQRIGADPQLFQNVSAVLRNAGERHQLEANLPFPGRGRLELKADIQGDVSRAGAWQADVYLNARGIALASMLQARIPRGFAIPSGMLNMELWSHWENGYFQRTQGSVDLTRLLLERDAGSAAAPLQLQIDRLGGSFLLTSQADGWELDIRGFEFERNGKAWPSSGLALSTRFDAAKRIRLLAGASYLNAEDLGALAKLFLIQQRELITALEHTAPNGGLRDLRFEFQEDEPENRWWLQGSGEALQLQPWKGLPGVRDLDLDFWLQPDDGNLQLRGQAMQLEFPGLFRDPLELKSLLGQVQVVRRQDGGWQVETPALLAVTRDIHTQTRMRLSLPAQPDESPFMDLQTDFSDGLAINAHRYYPTGIMPEAVVAWLDRGIVDGKVTSGSALVHGPLRNFPFHKTQDGVFEVHFHAENMTIDYSPGWPRLTDVAAEVRFLQNGFEVWVERGLIFDSQLQQVHGRIADFHSSPFELEGSVAGPLLNNLRLLRESPLAATYAAAIDGMVTQGDAVTLLNLTIPIHKDQAFDLNGKIEFDDNQLDLPEWELTLADIRGSLGFTPRKVFAQGLRAKLLGSELRLDVSPLSEARQTTRITARAQISAAQLARRFPELDLGRVTGRSAWTLHLDIPHQDADRGAVPSILATSDLRGIALELPDPLGKEAQQSSRFNLRMALAQQAERTLHLEYGDRLQLALALTPTARGEWQPNRGRIQFGETRAELPQQRGLEIGGRLKTLNMTAWSDLLRSQTGKPDGLPLRSIALTVDQTWLGETNLGKSSIDLTRKKDALSGSLSTPQAEGEIHIPENWLQQPVRVRLQRLSLDYTPDKEEQKQSASGHAIDPADLPALELEVAKFTINGHPFGSLQLLSRRLPKGLELQTLTLGSEQQRLSASGNWISNSSGAQQSRLQLSLNSESLGELLDQLGYQRYINEAPAVIDGRLEWPDWPGGYRLASVAGHLSLQLGKGQFLNVDPGIGRIFGLLNIAALQRRLSLDFSDLLGKGLAFDSVTGSFELKDGSAHTSDFRIAGPSAQLELSGRTGLVSEDFDQRVTVTPHVSAALPVAGLVAGGPIGGAAMLLAQGLIGKAVDKASRMEYTVKGPWSAPVMTRIEETAPASSGAAQ